MDELREFLGDSAWTNLLLVANIVVVSRMFPLGRTLSAQLTAVLSVLPRPKRAATEPGT